MLQKYLNKYEKKFPKQIRINPIIRNVKSKNINIILITVDFLIFLHLL